MLADPSLAGWDGFGLAVQAYQKRAGAVIGWLDDAAHALGRRLMVRLVKGAYWDTEVKRAQERGLADYPVFTRKPMTDLSYMACMRQLLRARPRLYPQFATHNALTVASVIEEAGGAEGYEFQRLHGMGEVLYDALLAEVPGAACRVYAPVGSHRDLLAYLVRRLLENGANSSFVAAAADPNVPIEDILKRPQAWIGDAAHARHPHIPLPRDLYRPSRLNSAGVEFGDRVGVERAAWTRSNASAPNDAAGASPPRRRRARRWPAAAAGFPAWNATPVERARRDSRTRRRVAGGVARQADRADAVRRRQDAGRRAVRIARGGGLLPLLRRRGAPHACAPARCRGRPANRTSCTIAGAACSSASARGIFRWRSFSARSPRRSPPAMPWWRSPPSRRR